jgi:hypothetical protein
LDVIDDETVDGENTTTLYKLAADAANFGRSER